MNPAFRYYGKQPSKELEKSALIVQAKYNLNDLQLAGLLQINDFFGRVVMFDTKITNLRLYQNGQTKRLPQGTIDFFIKFEKCSDLAEYFNPFRAGKYFESFAKRVLKNITKLSDYIDCGTLMRVSEMNIHHTTVEYREQNK